MQQYAKDNASVKYCYKFLEELNSNKEEGGKLIFKKFESLSLKDINFSYSSNQIFRNLSLELKKIKLQQFMVNPALVKQPSPILFFF